MADQTTPKPQGTSAGQGAFNFSPNTITPQDYQKVKEQLEDFKKQQLSADNEFMYQHYSRLIRAANESYTRATKANVVWENKQHRAEAKKRKESLRGKNQQYR